MGSDSTIRQVEVKMTRETKLHIVRAILRRNATLTACSFLPVGLL